MSAFSKKQAVAHHAYQWNATTAMAAHSRPDRHTIIMNRRSMHAKGGSKALGPQEFREKYINMSYFLIT